MQSAITVKIGDHSISATGASKGMVYYIDKPDRIEYRRVYSAFFSLYSTGFTPGIDLIDAVPDDTNDLSLCRQDYAGVGIGAIEAGPPP